MRKFFTGVPSDYASCVLLDQTADDGANCRVWTLVSTRDISGNILYGVAYSETGRVWWHPTLESASALFEHIHQHDRVTV